jgi:hypothetical protein
MYGIACYRKNPAHLAKYSHDHGIGICTTDANSESRHTLGVHVSGSNPEVWNHRDKGPPLFNEKCQYDNGSSACPNPYCPYQHMGQKVAM